MPIIAKIQVESLSSNIIYVPDDYPTIQAAISAASNGSMIIVHNGTYFENVVVNKKLTLHGVGKPIVDAGGSGNVVYITANHVNIRGFIIRNSGRVYAGIHLCSSNNDITDNTVCSNNLRGVYIDHSNNNNIANNNILNNGYGIYLYWSSNNKISDNVISNNNCGIYTWGSDNNNIEYNTISSVSTS